MWDEVTMTDKKGMEAVDRTIRDIMSRNELFGGKLVILSGDFRQTCLRFTMESGQKQLIHA